MLAQKINNKKGQQGRKRLGNEKGDVFVNGQIGEVMHKQYNQTVIQKQADEKCDAVDQSAKAVNSHVKDQAGREDIVKRSSANHADGVGCHQRQPVLQKENQRNVKDAGRNGAGTVF